MRRKEEVSCMEDRCATSDTRIQNVKAQGRRIAGNLQPATLRGVTAVAAAMLLLAGACGGSEAGTPPVNPPGTAGTGGPSVTLPAAGGSSIMNPVTTGTPTTTKPAGTAGATGTAGTGAALPTAGTGSPGDVTQPQAGVLPCGVSKTLAAQCQTCHAATPIAGAPMPLMTQADFHKMAVTKPTMKVYQVVKLRIHDTMRPMPPTTQLAAADMTAFDTWLDAQAPSATAAEGANCAMTPPTGMDTTVPDRADGSRGPLVPAPGETCYEFKTHNSTTSVDAAPYDVGGDGEHYEQFYFKTPWPANSVATAYATKMDNAAVLHHWLLFSTDEAEVEGFHKTAPLPTLIGTNPVLLAGWAVGGPNLIAPKDVGFELPNPGKQINVQWHFYNSTGKPQKDASAVMICTVPKAMVKNVGGITWLGTEDLGGNVWFGGLGMPAHQESTFTTTCIPGRRGIGANDNIQIIGFEPHMHRIGKNMSTSVIKKDGTKMMIFNKPFSFGNETHYYQDYTLLPGEKLETSCTFNNTNDYGVPFGESSDTEMCYQFVFAYPAHALSNGAPSLLGVPDTCW
jgi:hypothetical protein